MDFFFYSLIYKLLERKIGIKKCQSICKDNISKLNLFSYLKSSKRWGGNIEIKGWKKKFFLTFKTKY